MVVENGWELQDTPKWVQNLCELNTDAFWGGCKGKKNKVWSLSECSTFLSSEKVLKKSWFYGGFSSQEKGLERTFIFVTNPTKRSPCHLKSSEGEPPVLQQRLCRCQAQSAAGESFLMINHLDPKQRWVRNHDFSRPCEIREGFLASESTHIIPTTFRDIAFTARTSSI